MKLGQTISNIRKKKGLKQDELAGRSNISQTYLSQIENDKKTPNINTLKIISNVLNVPMPIIFFLSLDKDDIPEVKREAFDTLFSPFESFVENFFIGNDNSKK